jgi:AraC family transcriptional regulator
MTGMSVTFDELFGDPLARRVSVQGLVVSALDYAPWTQTPPHESEVSCLTVTLRGTWRIHTPREQECSDGVVHLVPAGVRHHSRFGEDGARMFALGIAEDCRGELQAAQVGLQSVRHFRDGRIEALARRALRELDSGDDLRELALAGLALEIVAQAARPHGNMPAERRARWLHAVEERLRAEFSRPPSMSELARDAGVHPVHLARSFRAATGLPVGAFVRKLRLDWAEEQLLRSDRPLAELSAEAGFADQSHFTRLFRARTGQTPARFRRRFTSAIVPCRRGRPPDVPRG